MAEGGEGYDTSPENRDNEELAKINQYQVTYISIIGL